MLKFYGIVNIFLYLISYFFKFFSASLIIFSTIFLSNFESSLAVEVKIKRLLFENSTVPFSTK